MTNSNENGDAFIFCLDRHAGHSVQTQRAGEISPARILSGEQSLLVTCDLTGYSVTMIKSFRHKGAQSFFETGSKAGIQPSHATRLRLQLTRLDDAISPQDMNAPGWKLHPLTGQLAGHWSVTVNGNWRLTFRFEGTDAVLVDYQDYH